MPESGDVAPGSRVHVVISQEDFGEDFHALIGQAMDQMKSERSRWVN